MNAARPYRILAVDNRGRGLWTGNRTRTFATVESARAAAFKLAFDILEVNPATVAVIVQEAIGVQDIGRTVERIEVVAASSRRRVGNPQGDKR